MGIDTMNEYIGRSITTGKYHRAFNENVTACNYSGQSRSAHNAKATDSEIANASPESFCKKCFPKGKPEIKGD